MCLRCSLPLAPRPCRCCCCCCFCSCCTASRVAFVRGRRTPRYQVSLTRTPPDYTTFHPPPPPSSSSCTSTLFLRAPVQYTNSRNFFPSSIFLNLRYCIIILRYSRTTPCPYCVYTSGEGKNKVFAKERKININRNLKPLEARAVT